MSVEAQSGLSAAVRSGSHFVVSRDSGMAVADRVKAAGGKHLTGCCTAARVDCIITVAFCLLL
jgi:hypothetical protein